MSAVKQTFASECTVQSGNWSFAMPIPHYATTRPCVRHSA